MIETSLVARQLGTVTEKTRGSGSETPKLQAFENVAHLAGLDGATQLALEPVHAGDGWAAGGAAFFHKSARPPTGRMPGDTSCEQFDGARQRRAPCCPGSCAFSNRIEASVRSFSFAEVLRMLEA